MIGPLCAATTVPVTCVPYMARLFGSASGVRAFMLLLIMLMLLMAMVMVMLARFFLPHFSFPHHLVGLA